MANRVLAKEVSQENISAVKAWIRGGDIGFVIDDIIPNELGVEASHKDDETIELSEPVSCNGNIVVDFKL